MGEGFASDVNPSMYVVMSSAGFRDGRRGSSRGSKAWSVVVATDVVATPRSVPFGHVGTFNDSSRTGDFGFFESSARC